MLRSKDFWMKKADDNIKKINCYFDIKSVNYISLSPKSKSNKKIDTTNNKRLIQSNKNKIRLKQSNNVNEINIDGSQQAFGLEKSIINRINEEKNENNSKAIKNNPYYNDRIHTILNENIKLDTISDQNLKDTINENENSSILNKVGNENENNIELPKIKLIKVKKESELKRSKIQTISSHKEKDENYINSMYPFNRLGKDGFKIKELTFKEKILNKKNEKKSILNKIMITTGSNTNENNTSFTSEYTGKNLVTQNFNNLRNVHLKASILKNQKEFYKKERIDIVDNFEKKIKTEINNIKRRKFDTFCPKSMFNSLSKKNIDNIIQSSYNINDYKGKMFSINKDVKNKLTIAPINKTKKTGFELLSEKLYYMEKTKLVKSLSKNMIK